ncbi:MAG: glycosyltransferase family 1 protein [Thermoproteota archaeon]
MNGSTILFNATFIHENPTGLGVYTYQLLKNILKLDINIVLTTYTNSTTLLREGLPPNIIPAPNFLKPGGGFLKNLARIVWLQLSLPHHIRRRGLKVIYSPVPEGIFLPPKGLRQVITVHDLLPILFWEEYPRIRYYMKYLLPVLLDRSTRLISVSENTKRDIVRFFGIDENKISVIYPGVDLDLFRPIGKAELNREEYTLGSYILFVGAMRRYKNIHRLIRAFGKLKIPELKLLIVGARVGSYYQELLEEVKKEGVEKNIYFLDYVEEDMLVRLYNGAIAFVFPSLYEGFGLPLLEAMACGCPVVASNRASIPEVCGDVALYFDPEDVEDMATKIYNVVTNDQLRKRLSLAGIQRASNFSWEITARKTLNLLYSMLE